MREDLGKLNGERRRFRARFVRFGEKPSYKGRPRVTLLLADVTLDGLVLTDHVWFEMSKTWERLALREGDRVEFDARVKTYRAGYRGRREDFDLPPPRIDYKLAFPTNVVLLEEGKMDAQPRFWEVTNDGKTTKSPKPLEQELYTGDHWEDGGGWASPDPAAGLAEIDDVKEQITSDFAERYGVEGLAPMSEEP